MKKRAAPQYILMKYMLLLCVGFVGLLTVVEYASMNMDGEGISIIPARYFTEYTVRTTESGIEIETLTHGWGRTFGAEDELELRYSSVIEKHDDVQFDAFLDSHLLASIGFWPNRVSFKEGLIGMKKGEKRRITVPVKRGDEVIASVIFEVELLNIKRH